MLKLCDRYLKRFIDDTQIESIQSEVNSAMDRVMQKSGEGSDKLGWVDLPTNYDKDEFERIKAASDKIQKLCKTSKDEQSSNGIFVVIGIGGSYLGARAAIEFVKGSLYNNLAKNTPDIYFAGNSISPSALTDLLKLCEGKDICVNVISKSGTTTEPAIAFRVFRNLLEEKYGEDGAKDRIFVTTDAKDGALRSLANEKGYESFVVPDDIGGRYSVLTAVGLLPIAVAGIDIEKIMNGAKSSRDAYLNRNDVKSNDCCYYAAIRNLLYRGGKAIEILASYEPALSMTAEWWKQLYGESEGKNGRGLFPASVIYSTDLHSLGQIVQEGRRVLMETVIDIKESSDDVNVPVVQGEDADGLKYIEGKSLHEINRTAFEATANAHTDGGVPNIVLELDSRCEESFGYLVYFFELACALSGYILGVNPFDQPGVEGYKDNMYALLGKAGDKFDKIRLKLESNNK